MRSVLYMSQGYNGESEGQENSIYDRGYFGFHGGSQALAGEQDDCTQEVPLGSSTQGPQDRVEVACLSSTVLATLEWVAREALPQNVA